MNGMKVYFDKITGEVLATTGEGAVLETTLEQDISRFTKLSERNPNSFDCIQLEYKQHEQDFFQCNGYQVNVATKKIEFSYPNPNNPETPPVFERPLSERLAEQEQRISELNLQDAALYELLIERGLI